MTNVWWHAKTTNTFDTSVEHTWRQYISILKYCTWSIAKEKNDRNVVVLEKRNVTVHQIFIKHQKLTFSFHFWKQTLIDRLYLAKSSIIQTKNYWFWLWKVSSWSIAGQKIPVTFYLYFCNCQTVLKKSQKLTFDSSCNFTRRNFCERWSIFTTLHMGANFSQFFKWKPAPSLSLFCIKMS